MLTLTFNDVILLLFHSAAVYHDFFTGLVFIVTLGIHINIGTSLDMANKGIKIKYWHRPKSFQPI